MKIAILGAGQVGSTLGKRFAEKGHEIIYGVPNPSQYDGKDLGGEITPVGEAAQKAKIIVLAVPFDAARDAVEKCGDVAGKILIDCTNPLGKTADGLGLSIGFETSGAEKIAEAAKGAKMVKCFNQTGFGNMAEPSVGGVRSAMFACGDDKEATETVRKLAAEIGFDAVNAGNLKTARLLEPLAMLWIHLAMTTDLRRDFAFAVLRRS